MRYCGRCWKERKGWLPDRPKPKHKKASRNSKEASGSTAAGGSSSRNKNKRTEGQAVKSSTRAAPSPTPEAAEPEANTSVASGSSEGPSGSSEGPSGSSQETLPDSGYSQSQELFSPNEEEEQRQDGKSLPPGFMDKRSRTIATSRFVTIFVSQFQ